MATGYVLIDLQNKNITTQAVEIPGIYAKIEGNYRRVLRLHNVVVNGIERPDGYCTLAVEGTEFTLLYGNVKYYLSVTDSDMVSLKQHED